MSRRLQLAAAIAVGLVATSADAQLGALVGKSLGMPADGEAGGAYQSNNQIRTYITARPYAGIDLFGKAITQAATMTRDKGFSRFGVTKYSCSGYAMGGRPVADSCYVIAIMLNDGEQAKPRGDREVHYYAVAEVLAGNIARLPGT